MNRYRLGVDVGGTFTDLVALDETSGELVGIKVSSTPQRPEDGVLDGFVRCRERGGVETVVVHSTTIATNALLGQVHLDLPRIALLTTAGFRDVLEIGRQARPEVYNLMVRRPRPLVDRQDRIGIHGRLGPQGEVWEPLGEVAVRAAAHSLRASGILVAAVCYLHSYANPAHERRTRQILLEEYPDLRVVLSSDVDPEYREYERSSTTVVDALLAGVVEGYLQRLQTRLKAAGSAAPIYVMQSNGGMATVDQAARRPSSLIESGPASGVIACAFLARSLGLDHVITFDMGGTTAKAGTVVGGQPEVIAEFEAAGQTHSGRAIKGSGYPVRFRSIDLAEISAGGGTVAWRDGAGALRVGPRSAGADPGPACYGQGGDQPTVTDANLALGRLNPVALAGGAVTLFPDLAERALTALGEPLGLSATRAAAGVIQIINNQMAKVLRIVTVERGYDPRRFAMIAFGGAGPLHAAELADELGIPAVVVPPSPGLFSAFGLLAADFKQSYLTSIMQPITSLSHAGLETSFAAMEERGVEELGSAGITRAAGAVHRQRTLDLRYFGQAFELAIPAETLSLDEVAERFHERHRQVYGYALPEGTVEVVSARVDVAVAHPRPRLATLPTGESKPPAPAHLGRRRVYQAGGWQETDVWRREALLAGNRIDGPAIVEQYDSCTLVSMGWSAKVDALGNLRMERM